MTRPAKLKGVALHRLLAMKERNNPIEHNAAGKMVIKPGYPQDLTDDIPVDNDTIEVLLRDGYIEATEFRLTEKGKKINAA